MGTKTNAGIEQEKAITRDGKTKQTSNNGGGMKIQKMIYGVDGVGDKKAKPNMSEKATVDEGRFNEGSSSNDQPTSAPEALGEGLYNKKGEEMV